MLSLLRTKRFCEDFNSLRLLSKNRNDKFYFEFSRGKYLFRYSDVAGLVKNSKGLSICTNWEMQVSLGQNHPIDPPLVSVRPFGQMASDCIPFHPNILSEPPYLLCYGRHLPILLLDELARRIERILMLDPEIIMPDEQKSLNPSACPTVRRLRQEKFTPLTVRTTLPYWCTTMAKVHCHA